MSLLARALRAEIPAIPERLRPLFTLYAAGFSVVYAVTFLATLHFIFLGPGLGDHFTLEHLEVLLRDVATLAERSGHPAVLHAFLGLLVFSTVFRAIVVFLGYASYRRGLGRDFPLDAIVTFGLVNLLNVVFAPLLLLLLGGAALALGRSPAAGLEVLARIVGAAESLVARVPTIVAMPTWLAFPVSILALTFVHYWVHRLAHTRRALWLVLHRPHHMPPDLSYLTALPVVMSFPFFLLTAFPYVVSFGVVSKLLSAHPLYAPFIVFNLVIYVGEIFGHTPAIYERAIRLRWVRAISFMYGQGVYHVIHHGSGPEYERVSNNNTVNIGPGPFCVWDLLFGTYAPLPERLPVLGLRGDPKIVMNPLRLLVAGVWQLAYELRHNPDPIDRLRILLGPSTYTPANSRDFAIHDSELDAASHATRAPDETAFGEQPA